MVSGLRDRYFGNKMVFADLRPDHVLRRDNGKQRFDSKDQ